MFLAGTNFSITYFGLHGQVKKVMSNDEFRYYFFFTILFALLGGVLIYALTPNGFEKSIRNSLFQVVSVITTTGVITADYTSWHPFLTVLFFMLMFIGGSAGSTAGGVKIIRHILLMKNSILELKRIIHPSAIIPVRINNKVVRSEISYAVLAFMIIYFMIFAGGSLVMAGFGLDFTSAVGSVATSLGNIGPGLGSVGPVHNFAHIPLGGKWVLSFLMLLGRLELFTVLLLFSPSFWRS